MHDHTVCSTEYLFLVKVMRFRLSREATNYIREELELGRQYGKPLAVLCSELDLDSGEVWAFLPEQSDPSHRAALRTGGIMEDQSANRELACWVKRELAAHDTGSYRVLLFEDPVAERSSSFVRRDNRPLVFVDHHGYLVIDSRQNESRIFDLLVKGPAFPGLGVLSELPSSDDLFTPGSALSIEQLRAVVDGLVALVVRAWDAEGFVVWQRAT